MSFERASAYVAKIPGAGKGTRNAEAFRISALLQKDFSLFPDESWAILTNWATTCDPQMDAEELQQCLVNGAKYGSAPQGSKAVAERFVHPLELKEMPIEETKPVLEFKRGTAVTELLKSGDPFMPRHRQGRFVKFGLPSMDAVCPTARGELGIIAAGTGIGKSTLATQGLFSTARWGHKTGLVSLEMIEPQVMARIGSHITGINHTELFEEGGKGVLPSTVDEGLLENIFFLCGMSGFNFDDMYNSIEHAVKTQGLSSVWIDYFTLVQPPDLKRQSGSAQIYADLSKAFKRMAQQLDISVVMLAQFNRSFQGAGQKPTMYNLKETSQLEQDASWVLIMWEDAEKNAWASLDKNRMGRQVSKVPITFDHARQRINEGHAERETTNNYRY